MTEADESPAPEVEGEKVGRIARLKGRVESERDRAQAWVDEARGRIGIVDGLVRAWEHDAEVGGGLLGGALAFRLFLFMVPYVLVVFTLIGSAATVADSSPTDMAHKAGISGLLAKGIFTTSTLTSTHQVVLLLLGTYAMVSAARSVVATLVASHCLAWRVPRTKLKGIVPALTFIVFVTATALLSSYIGELRRAAPAPGIALTATWFLVPLVAWWWASVHLPHSDAPTWALLPGATLFGVGIQALHVFTVVYVGRSVTSKSETYGAVGVALAVLAWAYLAGRLVSASAVLNAALWRRFQENHPEQVEALTHGDGVTRRQVWMAWVRSASGLIR